MTIEYSNTPGPIDGSLIAEIVTLAERVFGAMDSADSVWRLQNMPDLSFFAARSENLLVGFKMGYAVTSHRYYSWLGGVAPDHRRAGIARDLMTRQHEWIRMRGYTVIETLVVQDNHAMAKLNTEFGFAATGIVAAKDGSKIIYRKSVDPVHMRS